MDGKRNIIRAVVISFIIAFSCLSAASIISDDISIVNGPWVHLEQHIKIVNKVIVNNEQQDNDAIGTPLQTTILNVFNSCYGYMIYTIMFLFVVIAVVSFFNSVSLFFSKSVSQALLRTDSVILISGAILLNIAFGLVAFSVAINIFSTFGTIFMFYVDSLSKLMIAGTTFFTSIMWVGYTILSLFITDNWTKVISISCLVPSFILLISAVLSLFLYPIRKFIAKFLNALLFRSLLYKKGPIIFLAVGLGLVGSTILCVVKIVV